MVLSFFGQVSDSFNHLRTFVYVVKTIYALLAHMSWTKFTHFVRKVFARQSLPTGKLRLFRALGEAISHQFIMLLDPPGGPPKGKREKLGQSWDNFQARGGGFPCPNFLAPQNGTFS